MNQPNQLIHKELLVVNDDLDNYFRSNVNGQLIVNNDLQLVKFSPGTVELINLLKADIGRPLSNITTNIKSETLLEDIKLVLSNRQILAKEIETNNGKWYQVTTMPFLRQSDKKNIGAIITFNDITELKRIQLALKISEKMLGISIDAAELGTFRINAKNKSLEASARFREVFGFDTADVLSLDKILIMIDEAYRQKFNEAIDASINIGEKCDMEIPITNANDKKVYWVRIIGNLSIDNDNKPTYFTGIVNDITIHKQDELRKNDFIAMVSHDLKTPLTAIQAYIQLISLKFKSTEDAVVTSSFTKVNAAVKKMNRMINGFLTISSSEEGQIYLELETFEMNTLIVEMVEESNFIHSGMEICFTPGPELFLVADRDKIGQVINNLLSNAIKYSGNENLIDISLIEADGTAKICVKDKGIGIKPEDQSKLFDRYYRVKNKEIVKGFGLGLYLSSEIITKHSGKMWVKSEIDKGSSFFFSLPLTKA